MDITSKGCAPLLDAFRTVVLFSRWARHAEGPPFGKESVQTSFLATADRATETSAENHDIYKSALVKTLRALAELAREIIIIGPVPEIGRDVPNELATAAWRGRLRDLTVSTSAYRERQSFVFDSFAEVGATIDLTFFSPERIFCSNGRCDVVGDAGSE